jgi:hypothetical protein
LAAFAGKDFSGANIKIDSNTAKILDLVIPKDAQLSVAQQAALNTLSQYATQAGVKLQVIRM